MKLIDFYKLAQEKYGQNIKITLKYSLGKYILRITDLNNDQLCIVSTDEKMERAFNVF